MSVDAEIAPASLDPTRPNRAMNDTRRVGSDQTCLCPCPRYQIVAIDHACWPRYCVSLSHSVSAVVAYICHY